MGKGGQVDPAIRAQVLTRAVLPALSGLVAADPAAAKLVQGWRWSAGFGLAWQKPTMISIQGGKVEVAERLPAAGDLNLVFWTPESLLAAMDGGLPMPPPVPTGGFGMLLGLRRFDSLGKRLRAWLEKAKTPEADAACLRGVFGVLLRALPWLAKDPVAWRSLVATRAATARLEIPDLDFSGDIRWTGTQLLTSSKSGKTMPDVTIRFEGLETVRAAAAGSLDFQAAVGLGKIRIQGWIPFADALGVVLDRAEVYLEA